MRSWRTAPPLPTPDESSGRRQEFGEILPGRNRVFGSFVSSAENADEDAYVGKVPPAAVELHGLLVQAGVAGCGEVLVPTGQIFVEHHSEIALARSDQRRIPVDEVDAALRITDDVRAMGFSVRDDPSFGAPMYLGGQSVVFLQAPFELIGVGLEESTSRLRERAGRPRPIEVLESVDELGPGGESEVISSRKAGGNVFGRSVEPAQDASHPAAVVGGLVWAPLARLACDQRGHRHGVAIIEAAKDDSLVIVEGSDDEVELGFVAQPGRRAERTVECGKGGVRVRAGLEARLQVVDGDESLHAAGVDGSPVVAAESHGQVLELWLAKPPMPFQSGCELGPVEVSRFG
jgi:hypothetical protein